MSYLENQFHSIWLNTYPEIELVPQYRFIPDRKLTLDFAHPQTKVGIEIQGGTKIHGRRSHAGSVGIVKDYKKICLGHTHGWTIFPLSKCMIGWEYVHMIAQFISRVSQVNGSSRID